MPVPVVNIFSAADYDAQISRGSDVLHAGGIVVLPTETVYGAAALLSHRDGRRRLKELRGGPNSNSAAPPQPFTVHLGRPEDAARYLGEVGELGQRMMRKLWPGPVGLVFEVPPSRRAEVAAEWGVAESDLYDSGGGMTLRCPDHIVDGPVVITAAGTHSSSADQLAADLDGKADLIFDAGPTRFSTSSTIVKVGADRYEIVREGVYDERIIERLLRTTVLFVCSGNTCRSPMAEAITRQILAEKEGVPESELERKGISVLSAGAFAMPGARATPAAVARWAPT